MRKVYSTDLFMFSVSLWFSLGRSRVFRKFVHSMHIVKLFGMQLLIVLSYNPFYFYKIVGSKSQEFLRWNTELNLYSRAKRKRQTAQMGGWQVKWTEKLFMVLVIGASRWVDLHTCLPKSYAHIEALTGFGHTYAIQMVSVTPYSLKSVSLEQLPLWD